LVDPRPFAVGEIKDALAQYPHVGAALPALGYGDKEIRDLEATIAGGVAAGVEAVAIGTPIDLAKLVKIGVPQTRVNYEIALQGGVTLGDLLAPVLPAAGAAKR
jgi:predicted GTPase